MFSSWNPSTGGIYEDENRIVKESENPELFNYYNNNLKGLVNTTLNTKESPKGYKGNLLGIQNPIEGQELTVTPKGNYYVHNNEKGNKLNYLKYFK